MAASRKALHDLMDRLEPRIARGFAEAVARIKSRAQLARLTRAIEAGDIAGAFRAAG